jgi:dihydroorotate dehydrogenase
LAGASAVQVYTAAQLEGPKVFTELRRELPALLEKLRVPSVSSLIGAAHVTGSADEAQSEDEVVIA